MSKTVRIYGRTFTVSGGEKDEYFRIISDGEEITDSVLAAIRPHVPSDAVCLDVGANIGLYSLGLSHLAPQGQVYAFEPSPTTYGHLQANLAANCATNVDACNLALGASVGTVRFHDFSFFSAGSFSSDEGSLLSSESYGSESFEAAATTLDDFVADRGLDRVDVVKVDVEGAEMSVLAGAEKTLATYRPATVLEFSTFGFTIHQGVLPQVALARILEIFPHVFVIDRDEGGLRRLVTPQEIYAFLYDNGIHGPTDNLLCTFDDLPVNERYCNLSTREVAEAEDPRLAEAEAMRRTMSWRVTSPLRYAHRLVSPVITRAQALKRAREG